MQLSLAFDEYIVFDFETTGLSAWGGDEIVEIGAIKIFGDEVDERSLFHTLVNPKRPLSEEASQVNGITNDMLKDAPTIDKVFPLFLDFVGSSSLVAQNARFDLGFLAKYLVQFKIKKQLDVYDTMIFSRRLFPKERHHSLDAICQRLGLPYTENRHRSVGDIKLTAKAFLLLRDRLGEINHLRERFSA